MLPQIMLGAHYMQRFIDLPLGLMSHFKTGSRIMKSVITSRT